MLKTFLHGFIMNYFKGWCKYSSTKTNSTQHNKWVFTYLSHNVCPHRLRHFDTIENKKLVGSKPSIPLFSFTTIQCETSSPRQCNVLQITTMAQCHVSTWHHYHQYQRYSPRRKGSNRTGSRFGKTNDEENAGHINQ